MTSDDSGRRSKKAYLFDTNVILHDWEAVHDFRENDIYILQFIINEIDNMKKGLNGKGYNSRSFSRWLDPLTENPEMFKRGVLNESGGHLFILRDPEKLPYNLSSKKDSLLIAAAMELKKNYDYEKVAIVSKDLNLRILSRSNDILAEDYESDKVISKIEDLYSGTKIIVLQNEETWGLFSSKAAEQATAVIDAGILSEEIKLSELRPNQCCRIGHNDSGGEKSIWAIFKGGKFSVVRKPKPIVKSEGWRNGSGIPPR